MDTLKFSGRQLRATPLRHALDAASAAALTESWARDRPAAYVVRNRDLERLRRCDGVVDRGRKHRAMQLSRLLLGQDGIPLVSGTYTDARQLVRSVRSLLANATKRADRNLYVIGADEAVFAKLWRTAAPEANPTDGAGERMDADSVEVLDLLPRTEVPARLERQFVGTSQASELVRQLIVRAALAPDDVLILGDTGTGKEVVARCIQEESGRRPFVHVSCAAFGGDQLDLALFGRPAEGAASAREGLWQAAGTGMLFLDEIGGLRLDHQAKIMRALEERSIRPVGARVSVALPARVVAASNRELYALVQAGQFREDLYYRLRAFTIRIPPLRDHAEDIPVLAAYFWKSITWDEQAALPAEILSAMATYHWPGNARELRAVLGNLHTLFGRDRLRLEHLRWVFRDLGQAPAAGPLADGDEAEHLVGCLRHLRHVDEVVRACLMTIRPLVDGARVTAAAIATAHGRLHYRLHELELLCLQPLLFHQESTFAVVYRLKGKLAYFHGLLERDPKEATRYWRKQVADEIASALAAVLQEQTAVVKGLG